MAEYMWICLEEEDEEVVIQSRTNEERKRK